MILSLTLEVVAVRICRLSTKKLERLYILCVILLCAAVSNIATYRLWGQYAWLVVYEDKERSILVDFLFGWIDAREL